MRFVYSCILFISFLIPLQGQNYIDFQQTRIDRLDGREDGMIPDSLNSFVYFELIDKIQLQLMDSFLVNEDIKSTQFAIYNSLTQVSTLSSSQESLATTGLIYLEDYLNAFQQDEYMEYLIAYPDRAYILLPYISEFKGTEQFLEREAILHPKLFLTNFRAFSFAKYAPSLLSKAAQKHPVTIKRYLGTSNPIYLQLRQSENKFDQIILEIFKRHGRSSRAFPLLDLIASDSLTIDEANELYSESKTAYFGKLVEIASKSNSLAMFSVSEELEYLSINIIRPINAQYEAHESTKRFIGLNQYSSRELYHILVYSQDEIFTSTFTGGFQILLEKLENEDISAFQLIENVGYNQFRTFLKMCAGYGLLSDFLDKMSESEKNVLMESFMDLNTGENILKEAVSIADAMGSISDSSTLFSMETELNKHLNNTNSREVQLAYELLTKLFLPKAQIYRDTFLMISDKYKIPPLNYIDSVRLFGKDSIHTQVHFFYDDDDGKASYSSFISKYQNTNWQITDQKEFVTISSKTGKKVQILANKAQYDATAPKLMFAFLKRADNDVEVLVHRGHSFYVNKSLEHLQEEMCLVILGSCGGYHQVLEILEKSPTAQIIATKQVGTLLVNDPLIYQLVSEVKDGKEILWEDFWTALGAKFKPGTRENRKFEEYVPPYQNLGAGFIQAYRQHLYGK